MPARIDRREFAKSVVDDAIRRALDRLGGKPRRDLAHLIRGVQGRSDLLRPRRYVGRAEAGGFGLIMRGLEALAEHRRSWFRPIEGWEPAGSGPLAWFSSLAHHLLANYPVPPVLLSAWFEENEWLAWRGRHWFRHAGRGESLSTAGFPLRMTRRMLHEFAHAPAHFPLDFALRWAQVRGLGGSDEVARAVASTRLGRCLRDGSFWLSVIHLFLHSPGIDEAQIGSIVEYLHDQKFEPRRAILGEDTEVCFDPPRPDLCIKGCTVASLLRRAEAWRAERRPEGPQRRLLRWGPSGVGEFRREGESGLAWTIREILDSDAIAAEGKAMKHCVAEYAERCAQGRSSIWSLGAEGPDGRRRLVTIEVEPSSRAIVQASRRCNEPPDDAAMALLREWAGREGLGLDGLA